MGLLREYSTKKLEDLPGNRPQVENPYETKYITCKNCLSEYFFLVKFDGSLLHGENTVEDVWFHWTGRCIEDSPFNHAKLRRLPDVFEVLNGKVIGEWEHQLSGSLFY